MVITWQDNVQALLAERCTVCHSGAAPAGNYATTTYAKVLGLGRSTTANAIAGDPNSPLLQVLTKADPGSAHAGMQASLAVLLPWVVTCRLAYFRSSIHAGGILDPSQPDFHGKLNQADCRRCHGSDLAGGLVGVSCLGCHDQGPASCGTCHARITATEPHRTHLLGGGLAQTYRCTACHDNSNPLTDPNHGSMSSVAFKGPLVGGQDAGAVWDPQTKTCMNVYCHSVRGNDTAALQAAPAWSPNTLIQCGSCHGLPPGDGLHVAGTAIRDCVRCHPSTMDRSGLIVTQSVDGGTSTNHLNGVIDVP